MKCPSCGAQRHVVIDTRTIGQFIHRRRKCMIKECARRFTTIEMVAETNSSRRTHFNKQLIAALKRAQQQVDQDENS